MKIYIGISLLVSLFFLCGCQNHNSTNLKLGADTIVSLNSLNIKYHLNPDTVRSPFIMETTTKMITDSMLDTKQYNILTHDTKYDSVNYMNCVNGENLLPIKFYSLNGNVLYVSIYFSTQAGWYYEGEISTNEQNKIVLRQGKHRVIESALRPIFSELAFKIFIPKDFKLNSMYYECPIL